MGAVPGDVAVSEHQSARPVAESMTDQMWRSIQDDARKRAADLRRQGFGSDEAARRARMEVEHGKQS